MRACIGRRLRCPGSSAFTDTFTKNALIQFSTSSDGGGGRGRGRGGPTPFGFTAPVAGRGGSVPGDSSTDDSERLAPPLGHGRGKPLPSSSTVLPSFNTFVSSVGRGRAATSTPPSDPDGPKKPIFFKNEVPEVARVPPPAAEPVEANRSLPASILSVLSSGGAGRGKPAAKPSTDVVQPKEENRHLRARPFPPPEEDGIGRTRREPRFQPQGEPSPGGRGGRGQGYQARGRGRGRGRGGPGRGRGFRDRDDRRREEDADDEPGAGLYLGEGNDDEKMAEKLGPDTMNQLTEAFEEISERVLPSPAMDMYLDTFHTNCMIEFEPEYHMADFQSNPDIDEKPPISLRDALEKMKPFLMLYEGIKDQQEWEEVMKETMERAPLIKEIVDYYSGPNRVTAMQQQQELERVAKTLPKGVPASVEAFTNRAVLSLQSNPGWGFDKKCQFMDKLVWEVSNQYK